LPDGLGNVAHVAEASEAQHATPLVQQRIYLFGIVTQLIDEIENDGRVYIARAGTHDEPAQRTETHAGVQ
jgi:hypothetical protein